MFLSWKNNLTFNSIFKSSNLQINIPSYLAIFKSSNIQINILSSLSIFKSPNLQINIPSYLAIFKSPNSQINIPPKYTFSNLQIFKSIFLIFIFQQLIPMIPFFRGLSEEKMSSRHFERIASIARGKKKFNHD